MKSLAVRDSPRVARPARTARQATLTEGGRVQRAHVRNILDSGDVQAKLTIGQPNDTYEQEADRVADHVVAGQPAPGISSISSPSSLARKPDEQAAGMQQPEEEQKEPEEESGLYLLQPATAADAGEDDEEPVQARLVQRQAEEEEEPVQARLVQRQAEEEEEPVQAKLVQRKSEEEEQQVQAKASAAAASAAVASKSGGSPMRPDVRGRLESSMGTDLSGVRVHEGGSASAAARSINARAFTHQSDIWLGEGESQSDLHLMAHEATHVLQQGGVARRKPAGISAVAPRVQRWWNPIEALGNAASAVSNAVGSAVAAVGDAVGDVLGFIKDKALEFVQEIPGYSLFTVVLGKDPITDQAVARNGRNFIEAGLDIIPNGGELKQKMQENGKLEEAAAWLDAEIAALDIDPASIARQLGRFWDTLGPGDLLDPGGALSRLMDIVRGPIERIIRFAMDLAGVFLKFIKDALVSRLIEYARTIRGYTLMTVILGKDPFSEEPVGRSTENIVHGFMALMDGGEEKFQEMKQTGAIERMTTRVEQAMLALNFTWEFIRGLFVTAWESFGLPDIANPFAAFQRIIDLFVEPISRLFNFIVAVIRMVIEVALELMNFPIALISNIITKAMQAINDIKRDPIGFLKNLLRAVKTGFVKFFDNIVTHLINGITGWLFGQMEEAGITPPPDLSFQSILGLVMQILGITMDKIFKKLAEKIGQEKVDRIRGMMDRLSGIWAFVKDVMTRGPVAIWEYIQEKLSNLWDVVLEQVRNWVITKIVQQVTAKLLSMLDPTGIMAVINGFIAFYNAVQSFIQYLREMLEIVNSFVEGVAEIATGSVERAANFLENALDRAMPVAIGFLANQVGLGSLGRKIGEMIGKVQDMVDKGLDWLIDKAVSAGTSFLNMVTGRGQEGAQEGDGQQPPDADAPAMEGDVDLNSLTIEAVLAMPPSAEPRDAAQKRLDLDNAGALVRRIERSAETTGDVSSYFPQIKRRFGMQEISFDHMGERAASIHMKVNPEADVLVEGDFAMMVGSGANVIDSGGEKVTTDVQWTSQSLSIGDQSDTVGKRMVAYPLANDHAAGEEASSNPSVQRDLMSRLPGNGDYVRGHLLNATVGGPARPFNLFPITRQANSDHKNWVESYVKEDIRRGYVGKYEVLADASGPAVKISPPSTPEASSLYSIEGTFTCHYWRLKANLEPVSSPVSITIHSVYGSKPAREDAKQEWAGYYDASRNPVNDAGAARVEGSSRYRTGSRFGLVRDTRAETESPTVENL